MTKSITGIVTNSTKGIVTNSTTGIGTVQLLSGEKCKIISTGLKGYTGSGGVAPVINL
jgi:hypothetical protein